MIELNQQNHTKVQSPSVDPREAAEILGISEPTVCRLCRSGEIKAVKIGRQWRVSREWLMQYAGLV